MWKIGILCNDFEVFTSGTKLLPSNSGMVFEQFDEKVSYDAVLITVVFCSGSPISCPVVILPGECKLPVVANSAISFGMSPKDTLTVSSVSDDGIIVAVRRDFPSLSGEMIMRGEFPFGWKLPVSTALPFAALSLISGAELK